MKRYEIWRGIEGNHGVRLTVFFTKRAAKKYLKAIKKNSYLSVINRLVGYDFYLIEKGER